MPDNKIIFRRRWYVLALMDLGILMATSFSLWLTVNALFFYRFEDVVKARLVSSAFLLVFCPVLFVVRTFLGEIHTDNEGIGWWAWGRRWRYVRWADVRVMTIKTVIAYNQFPPTVTLYSFYRTEKTPQFNLLRFGDDIPNAQALIEIVMRNLHAHGVEIRRLPSSYRAGKLTDT